jgi:hypothetical protein
MKKQILSAVVGCFVISNQAFSTDNISNCEKGDMTNSIVRQSNLIGKWKQIGIEDEGKIIKMKINLIHEFTSDCKVIARMSGEPGRYKYILEGNNLILTSETTGRSYSKKFTKVENNLIIHGGDVFERVE